jgi:hypothetical protein
MSAGWYVPQEPALCVSTAGWSHHPTKTEGAPDSSRESRPDTPERSPLCTWTRSNLPCLGDGVPGGDFLSEEFVRAGGRWDTLDLDYCAALTELLPPD